MELEWDRKEREARRDLEGEETEHKMSKPEETMSRRANPMTSQDGAVQQGVFSNEHMDHGYGAAADVRRVVLYEGLKRDPRTGQSIATGDLARQYMNPGQVLERTLTLEGHIEIDKFSVEMMALEDVVILRDLCNAQPKMVQNGSKSYKNNNYIVNAVVIVAVVVLERVVLLWRMKN